MTQKTNNPTPAEASPHPGGSGGRTLAWSVAALGNALEALGLLVLAGLSLSAVISGTASATSRGLTEAVVLLVLAVGVGLLAYHLLRRHSLAKTPTLLWNAMLLPVSYSLLTGGAPRWGALVALVAVVTIGGALAVPRYDLAEPDEHVR